MSLSLTPFGDNYWAANPTWNLFDRELDRDMARMHRLINESTQPFAPDQHGVYHRQPNYSYEENDDHAYIEVELPGVPKENVKVDLQGKRLVISAKRFKPGTTVHVHVTSAEEHHDEQTEEIQKDTEVKHTKEQDMQAKPSVQYELKLRVGQKYDSENIQATMEGDGLLKMLIPLKKKDTSRPIQIQSASM